MRAEYISADAIIDIQKAFDSHMATVGVDVQTSPVSKVREAMFDFFGQEAFLYYYFLAAKKAADSVGLLNGRLVLQSVPTPRIFRPGSHGTSFHCDYWYGHGLSTFTVWIPMTPVERGNSFFICDAKSQDVFYDKLVSTRKFTDMESELLDFSAPVLPDQGSAFIFHSQLLHGSPKNTSSRTRVSFDFRIGSSDDPSSTKDLSNYYHFESGQFVLPMHPLNGKKVLKYICGGEGKNTFAQHAIIEESARRYSMNISEQEAEIERYGYPMLQAYLSGAMKNKNIEGIIIASKTIIDVDIALLASTSTLKVWCALENMFLK